MQDDSIEIEPNMMASRKLKTKVDMGIREPRRFREQAEPSSSGKNSKEEKMDEKMEKTVNSKQWFQNHLLKYKFLK
jgi:hypothetical protein